MADRRTTEGVARLLGAEGRRVVVRYRRPDGWLTDVLGTLESVGTGPEAEVVVTADRDGSRLRIPVDAVVAGKPVPPPPRPVRDRRPQ